jgi:putative membrane protein
MVEYNPKNWFTVIFQPHRSDMMRYIIPNMLMLGVYSAGLTYLFLHQWQYVIPKEAQFHALLGVVLGLVLVFRTNTAYDRWWEGRKLWGSLVNFSRSMAMKVNAALPAGDSEGRKYFAESISNFAAGLKNHLRNEYQEKEMQKGYSDYAAELEGAPRAHVPNIVGTSMHRRLNGLLKNNVINGDQYRDLVRDVDGLIDVMGACERIKNTPIPYSYSMYMKKVIFAYLISLPFSFITLFGWWTVPAVMMTTYVLAGLELIGEEIEDPFGKDANDLDTDGLSVKIRQNVDEIILGIKNDGI